MTAATCSSGPGHGLLPLVRFIAIEAIGAAIAVSLGAAPVSADAGTQAPPAARPRVGIALGGGSARGIAHVGVLRWLEDHRIPIDVISGTSMGGLIGGSYATGMSPDEVESMLRSIDWNTMFDASNFRFQNVRRKRDSRAYPSHLEFGFKRGLSTQTSLNGGQTVDLLLGRIAAPYYALDSFAQLPTPFRCVAFDLISASRVVLDRGSLARAMRATMSLPAVFPPVVLDDQVLVDGGTVDNVPADVAHDMGADRVIAVNVGDLADKEAIATSLLGVAGGTLDAMMRANTLKGLGAADVVINVPLKKYGSLDWRRSRDLIREGYDAADSMKDQLLPLAVDETAWEAWRAARAAARRTALPELTFVDVEGAASSDTAVMKRALESHVGRTLDLTALETTITELGGIGRYETLVWQVVERDGVQGLLVRAIPKPYAPPFLFLAVSLENTTSSSFRFGLSGRYLAFDTVGAGSELRIDAAIGSDPSAGIALYRPLWSSPFFVEPAAAVQSQTLNFISQHNTVAAYNKIITGVGADVGVNLGRLNEARIGVRWGHLDTNVQIGDPGLPAISGEESLGQFSFTHDSQDSAIVPTRGVHALGEIKYFFTAPTPKNIATNRTTEGVTQAAAAVSWLRSLDRSALNRLFLAGGAGTSFDGKPLPTEQFALGGPLRLGALDVGEKRGDHFVLASGGFLRQLARLPDFLGGPVLVGGWLEEGSAFDSWSLASWETDISVGLIAETLVGPLFLSASKGFDGASRFYVGVGRIFR